MEDEIELHVFTQVPETERIIEIWSDLQMRGLLCELRESSLFLSQAASFAFSDSLDFPSDVAVLMRFYNKNSFLMVLIMHMTPHEFNVGSFYYENQ